MTRLLLADDHRMLRDSLRRSLEEHGFAVVGEAGDGAEAVRLCDDLRPDVVLMDVTMPVLDGVEAARRICRVAPESRVVMLTMHADDDVMARAAQAGAVDYLVKDCSVDDIVATLNLVAGRAMAPPTSVAPSTRREATDPAGNRPGAAPPPLSGRELEVLQLVADGLSLPEVAARLFISVKTVKNHLASIYAKLDARDRTQAVLRAVRAGLVRLG